MFLGLLPASMFVPLGNPSEGYKFAVHTEHINFCYTYIKLNIARMTLKLNMNCKL